MRNFMRAGTTRCRQEGKLRFLEPPFERDQPALSLPSLDCRRDVIVSEVIPIRSQPTVVGSIDLRCPVFKIVLSSTVAGTRMVFRDAPCSDCVLSFFIVALLTSRLNLPMRQTYEVLTLSGAHSALFTAERRPATRVIHPR